MTVSTRLICKHFKCLCFWCEHGLKCNFVAHLQVVGKINFVSIIKIFSILKIIGRTLGHHKVCFCATLPGGHHSFTPTSIEQFALKTCRGITKPQRTRSNLPSCPLIVQGSCQVINQFVNHLTHHNLLSLFPVQWRNLVFYCVTSVSI